MNGVQDWGWAFQRNFANTSPVHSGTASVSATASAFQALWFHLGGINTAPYASLSFWAHGGTAGGQLLQVLGVLNGNAQTAYTLPALTANTWKQFTVPLSSLSVSDKTNCQGFEIQLRSGGSTGTFYVDDVVLTAKPAPATIHLSVNSTQAARSVESRWFGVNTAIWDSYFDSTETLNALREMGCTTLRFPGGSLSDEYHWASNMSGTNTFQWATSFSKFAHIATNLGANVFITVNYGTGTPAEAAGWVRHSNLTNKFGFKYWEIGNENYGTWETDTNKSPHDAYTYATRAKDYFTQMKAADPSIKVGVLVTPDATSYANGNTSHPVVNPRTQATVYGWTPVLLSTLKNLGITPDFVVYHFYPEYTGTESDPLLLQSSVNWSRDAADLRQQISDYFGAGGSNIEIVCTENNSNSGTQGRQSTSLVNGLYLADSFGQMMKTEFNSFIWWDLRNGRDTAGSTDATLYGWRTYGDLGMIDGASSRYPTFYAMKLLQKYARAGDTVLSATSDYLLLSAYAVRRTNGALKLLVINKDTVATMNAQISIPDFSPATQAMLYSYGIPQDDAARTGVGSKDISTNTISGISSNFAYSFPPLSLSVFDLVPARTTILLSDARIADGAVVFNIQSSSGATVVLQKSLTMQDWNAVSTNSLSNGTVTITNVLNSGESDAFWRAVLQP